jgi:hypothetical protein
MASADKIIKRLTHRWSDLAMVARKGCSVCERFADEYNYDDYSGIGTVDAAEEMLPQIACLPSSCLRECPQCGALFEEPRFGLTAADNLFASAAVELRRISPGQAILLLKAIEGS